MAAEREAMRIMIAGKAAATCNKSLKRSSTLLAEAFIMNYFLLLAGGILFSWQGLIAQNISGKVTDSLSGEPVPFATVQFDKGRGVITNEEGYFQLRPDDSASGVIVISCLGFETKAVALNELSPEGNVISLKEAVVRLDEVFLSNKIPHADTIIARVREHIAVNYRPRLKRHHIFARETEYVDFEEMDFEVSRASGFSGEELHQTNLELNALSKAIINNRTLHFRDFLGDIYLDEEKSAKLEVEKATSLLDSKKDFSLENIQRKAEGIVLQYLDTTQSYKLKTGIIKLEDSLKLDEEFREPEKAKEYEVSGLRSETAQLLGTSRFHEDSFLQGLLKPRAYDFSFRKATFLNDELIYILDFQPRKGSSRYSGKIFVNGNDFAIVKLNYRFAEGKRGDKFNFKLLLGIKYVEDEENGTLLYKKGPDGTYDPSYIQRTQGSYFYVNRPIKFIENSREKDKVNFNFIIAGKNRSRQELLVTSSSGITASDFQRLEEREKVPVIQLGKYEESIWQDEETLQPLEEMRQFNALQ